VLENLRRQQQQGEGGRERVEDGPRQDEPQRGRRRRPVEARQAKHERDRERGERQLEELAARAVGMEAAEEERPAERGEHGAEPRRSSHARECGQHRRPGQDQHERAARAQAQQPPRDVHEQEREREREREPAAEARVRQSLGVALGGRRHSSRAYQGFPFGRARPW
jgi:hypothetical protein